MLRHLVLCTALLLSIAAAARGAIAGADNPKGVTQHDAYRTTLEFNQRTLAGAYKQVGKRDPKWDTQALALLDTAAEYFSAFAYDDMYVKRRPTNDEMLPLCEAATAAGCDDPLVQYLHGAILENMGRKNDAIPFIHKAAEAMPTSGYPPVRVVPAMKRAAKLLLAPADAELRKRAVELHKQWTVKTFAGKLADADFRPTIDVCGDIDDDFKPDDALKICAEIEQSKDADPYVVNLLSGRVHIKKAWEHRGSGWANTVTEAGWKGFYEHLGLARDRLTKAQNLRPDLPYAATSMITVAMGGGGELHEKERTWFDRATTAQVDYRPAYTAYIGALLPRWGGSYEEMFALGVECFETGRYDTTVPLYLYQVISRIDDDSTKDNRIFRDKDIYTALTQLFDEVEAKSPWSGKHWYRSLHMAVAWCAGRYDDAIKLLDQLGDKADPRAFNSFTDRPDVAMSELHARKAQGDLITTAVKIADAGQHEAATPQFEAIAAKLEKDHPGRLFITDRVWRSRVAKAFKSGEWVSVMPDNDALLPWRISAGTWKRQPDGSLLATAGNDGPAHLVSVLDLGPSFEVRATVSFAQPLGTAAIYGHYWTKDRWGTAGLLNARLTELTAVSAKGRVSKKVDIGETNEHMHVVVKDGTLTVLQDGKPIGNAVKSAYDEDRQGASHLAIGSSTFSGRGPAYLVTFHNVEIRRVQP